MFPFHLKTKSSWFLIHRASVLVSLSNQNQQRPLQVPAVWSAQFKPGHRCFSRD